LYYGAASNNLATIVSSSLSCVDFFQDALKLLLPI
jgi:hypothetical protein